MQGIDVGGFVVICGLLMSDWFGLFEDWFQNGYYIDQLFVFVYWLIFVVFVVFMIYFVLVLVCFCVGVNFWVVCKGLSVCWFWVVVGGIFVFEVVFMVFFEIFFWVSCEWFFIFKELMVVCVMGEQFVWNFYYFGEDGIFGVIDFEYIDEINMFGLDYDDLVLNDDFVMINQMYVLFGKLVFVLLGLKDVIYVFLILVMRVKQDVIFGLCIGFSFIFMCIGCMEIVCVQFCGLGYYCMCVFLIVELEEDFVVWFEEELEYM